MFPQLYTFEPECHALVMAVLRDLVVYGLVNSATENSG